VFFFFTVRREQIFFFTVGFFFSRWEKNGLKDKIKDCFLPWNFTSEIFFAVRKYNRLLIISRLKTKLYIRTILKHMFACVLPSIAFQTLEPVHFLHCLLILGILFVHLMLILLFFVLFHSPYLHVHYLDLFWCVFHGKNLIRFCFHSKKSNDWPTIFCREKILIFVDSFLLIFFAVKKLLSCDMSCDLCLPIVEQEFKIANGCLDCKLFRWM